MLGKMRLDNEHRNLNAYRLITNTDVHENKGIKAGNSKELITNTGAEIILIILKADKLIILKAV